MANNPIAMPTSGSIGHAIVIAFISRIINCLFNGKARQVPVLISVFCLIKLSLIIWPNTNILPVKLMELPIQA